MRASPSNVIGSAFAMAAFSVATVAGLFSGNDSVSVLVRAIVAMIVCYPVGLIVGLICERVITAHTDELAEVLQSDAVRDHLLPSSEPVEEVHEESATMV